MKPIFALLFTLVCYGLFIYWRLNGEEWMHWLGWILAGCPGLYYVWFKWSKRR